MTLQVILKTLMVFHKIMREGDQFFMESLKNKAHALFALRNFTGNPSKYWVQTIFRNFQSSDPFIYADWIDRCN